MLLSRKLVPDKLDFFNTVKYGKHHRKIHLKDFIAYENVFCNQSHLSNIVPACIFMTFSHTHTHTHKDLQENSLAMREIWKKHCEYRNENL